MSTSPAGGPTRRLAYRRPAVVVVFVVLFAVVAAGLSTMGSPAGAYPGEPDTPIDNPDLPRACGIDIHVILDESGSVKNFKADVQRAFRSFTAALKNTGSRLAVSEFSTVARLPLSGAAQRSYTVVTDQTINDTFEPYIATRYTPDGATNWEDGLRVARHFLTRPSTTQPHLVVFITDGNPNRIIRQDRVTRQEYETKIPLDSGEVTDAKEDPAADRAVPNANAVKTEGSHILAIAVGDGLSGQSALNRLIKIAGPDVFDGSGTFDISTTDVYKERDFSKLEQALREAAFQLCAPSVTVRKLLDLTPDTDEKDAVPGADFALTAKVSPPPKAWVLPAGATGDTATTTTDANGFANFQWDTTAPSTSTATITEVDPSSVIPDLVYAPELTACTFRTPDSPNDAPLPTSPVSLGFTVAIPPDAIVTCTIYNRVPPDPSITLDKRTNGEDADSPTGPTIAIDAPVEWTYELTNTGNVTLRNVAVSDDQGVTVTCPSTALAPGDSATCTATGKATAGQYANVGTVTAIDPLGKTLTASDPSHYLGVVPGIEIEKATNGRDADAAPGVYVAPTSTVTWTYVVTNVGASTITDIVVTDDKEGLVTCPSSSLTAGASMTCTPKTGTATSGQYRNVATVSGTAAGTTVVDADPSHYFGVVSDVTIVKETNGEDANTPTGPAIPVGDDVLWTYRVTNTGNAPLIVLVDDDKQGRVTCPRPFLLPGDDVVCFATGKATAGQYANVGTVTAVDPLFRLLEESDPSHYFGVQPALDVEKKTNGDDADQQPGPFVPVGSTVTWTYEVTNTGNATLTSLILLDIPAGGVTCPKNTLAPGETITCTKTGTAVEGQYVNVVRAGAFDPLGEIVRDDDPSHYFGATPGISIEKSTNGDDADEAPGPFVPEGQPVDWTYEVANTGNSTVTNVTVTDDKTVPVTCPKTTLGPLEQMTCTGSGTAARLQYENVGTVAASTALGGTLTASDPSHYFGFVTAIDLQKLTNGEDADDPTGPKVPVGSEVRWSYVVTNTGDIPITSFTIVDSDPSVGITCPRIGLIPPGGNVTCFARGTAVAGQYANTATVDALDALENTLTATDPSHYFGDVPPITDRPAIDIEKATNGEDADTPTGPLVPVGSTVTWTYRVTNTGNVALSGLVVTDDRLGTITCPTTTLTPGAATTCTATGAALPGQYANVGTARAVDPSGFTVADTDPSHYRGVTAAIDIEKATNGEDADTATGPLLLIGSRVTWTYVVRNTGAVTLTNLLVTDDRLGTITCPTTTLTPSAATTCTATGTALPGQYANVGTATAVVADGGPAALATATAVSVTDSDPSHYLGVATLPETGADPWGAVRSALLLLAVGVGLVLIGRRSSRPGAPAKRRRPELRRGETKPRA